MVTNNLLDFIVNLMYTIMSFGHSLLDEFTVERHILGFSEPITLIEIMFGLGVGVFIVRIIQSFFG